MDGMGSRFCYRIVMDDERVKSGKEMGEGGRGCWMLVVGCGMWDMRKTHVTTRERGRVRFECEVKVEVVSSKVWARQLHRKGPKKKRRLIFPRPPGHTKIGSYN